MAEHTSVIIASNRPLVSAGLRAALDGADGLMVMGAATSAVDLLALMSKCPECIAVADAAIVRDAAGAQVLKQLRERGLARKVVCIGPDRPLAWLGLAVANGCGCVLDTEPIDELLRVTLSAAVGEQAMSATLAHRRQLTPGDAMAAQPAKMLTEREIEVFDLLARGHGDVDIGRRMGISARTVAFHVAEVRERLGAATRIQAVVAAIRDGWLPLSGG